MNRRGATVTELVVAMAVTGALALVVLAAYSGVLRGFSWNSRRAADIQEMIVTRARVNEVLQDVAVVVACRKGELEYRDRGDSLRTLAFTNRELRCGTSIVATGFRSFDLAPGDKVSADGRSILIWEAVLPRGRWIGGAVTVRK